MNIFLKFQGETRVLGENELRELLVLNQEQGGRLLFLFSGKICDNGSEFHNHQTIHIHGRLLGGKGGFGAKLKTQGGKKVRPNENMFSRDMQGQPIAYATINREYEQHYRQRLLENQKVQKQLAEFQVVSRTYKEDYASTKLDSTYNVEMQENQRRLKDAMKIGMKRYLEKKRNGGKGEEKGEEKDEQREKGDEEEEEVEKFSQDEVKEDEEEEIEGKKRSAPIGQPDEADKEPGQQVVPTKRVKPNIETPSQTKTQQEPPKPQVKKPMSAAQKLKSLFKK